MEYLLYLGALALIAVGLAGTVIPAIPGLPIIFAGSWLIGWASGYELISVTAVVILALLAAVGIGIDILAQILGAKRAGASRAGLWGAVIGRFPDLQVYRRHDPPHARSWNRPR